MISRATVLAVSSIAFAFGCAAEPGDSAVTQEIIDNLVQAGFPTDDIMVVDGAVYVGRDAHVTLEASREMLETDGSSQEQYRTTNLVSSSKTKICVNPSSAFTGGWSTGLDLALANYTGLALSFDMVRGPTTGCSANISAVISTSMVGGSAGFPSGGNPYGKITVGGLLPYGTNVIEHVITHELGHTIGFRHSDYYNRAISCGSGGNEGTAGVGAILIPGTPSGATVGGSIMNSCFRTNETGEFTNSDKTALNALY
jgi:hypothetical protein